MSREIRFVVTLLFYLVYFQVSSFQKNVADIEIPPFYFVIIF